MKRRPLNAEERRAQEVRRENATAGLEEAEACVAKAAKRLAEAKQAAKDAKDVLECCRAAIVQATEWLELGRPDDGQQRLPGTPERWTVTLSSALEAEADEEQDEDEAPAPAPATKRRPTKRRGGGL